MSQPVYLNGINGSTGEPLDDFQVTTDLLAKVARRQPFSKTERRDIAMRKNQNERSKAQMGGAEGVDINLVSSAGWGIIFPANLPAEQVAALRDALNPLLELRREQAGRFYFEFIGPEHGYRAGESKNDFLTRHGRAPGAANPALGVPFYLLIVGSPEEIPFEFQYLLDLQYGVGRIHFDQVADYARYAESVVGAERGQVIRHKRASFFGPSHDFPTGLSSRHLVAGLTGLLAEKHSDWEVRTLTPEQSTKTALGRLMGGDETPAFLFTASHGMGFKLDDPRLLHHTGALLCQDFTRHRGGRIDEQFYFSADDLVDSADVAGTLAFFFACYGAGSPRIDNFHRYVLGGEKIIAPYPFLSRLPTRLLRAGALGVFAHVDRAWAYSFMWNENLALVDIESFRSLISTLLEGHPAGAAGDYFGMRYGDISAMLTEEIEATTLDHQDENRIAWWWLSHHDARNYAFIGDPAVRLAVSR